MSTVKRKTKFIVYVGTSELDKPASLCDATMSYLIKKDYPIDKRKKFLALYMKAVGKKAQMTVINEWVQVRDIATFPFRRKAGEQKPETSKPEETNEDSKAEGGVSVDDGADGEEKSGATPE